MADIRTRLAKMAGLAARRLQELADLVDEIENAVASLGGADPATDSGGLSHAAHWDSPAAPISLLTITPLDRGRSRVTGNGHLPLVLSRRLTELLVLLTSGTHLFDGLVSFLPVTGLAKSLRIRKASVFNLISRLRHELAQCGWNPNLVESRRSKPEAEVRFRAMKITVNESVVL